MQLEWELKTKQSTSRNKQVIKNSRKNSDTRFTNPFCIFSSIMILIEIVSVFYFLNSPEGVYFVEIELFRT